MKSIAFASMVIALIAAATALIITGHPVWGGICLFLAITAECKTKGKL